MQSLPSPTAPRYPKAEVRIQSSGRVNDVVSAVVRAMVRVGASRADVDAFLERAKHLRRDGAIEAAREWVTVEVTS